MSILDGEAVVVDLQVGHLSEGDDGGGDERDGGLRYGPLGPGSRSV